MLNTVSPQLPGMTSSKSSESENVVALPQLTPLRAIRKHCVSCCGGGRGVNGPEGCNSPDCGIFPLRHGKRVTGTKPMKSIRARCLDCAGSAVEVQACEVTDCELHPYRLGHNPRRAGMGGRIGEIVQHKRPDNLQDRMAGANAGEIAGGVS